MIEKIKRKIQKKRKAYEGRPVAFLIFLVVAVMKKVWNILLANIKRPFYNTRFLKNRERNKRENLRFFNNKRYASVNAPVADLYLMQSNKGMDSFEELVPYDAVVRYMAVEDYYEKNGYGFKLYNQMNEKAGIYRPKIRILKSKREKAYQGEYHSEAVFRQLIESYERNGYLKGYPVWFDKTGLLINGSHRFALALYSNQEYIEVNLCNWIHNRKWSIDWFWKNCFSQEDIDNICKKEVEIMNKVRKQIGSFYCVLYPPAESYFEEITQDIVHWRKDEVGVVKQEDFYVTEDEFINFTNLLYYFDCISPEHLAEKQRCIIESSRLYDKKLHYRVLELSVKNPRYHLKSTTGITESVTMVRLKALIRTRYADKIVRAETLYNIQYPHDIIIHSTDNYISNNAYRQMRRINRDISHCFIDKHIVFDFGDCIDIVIKENIESMNNVYEKVSNHFGDIEWLDVNMDENKIWCDFRGKIILTLNFVE